MVRQKYNKFVLKNKKIATLDGGAAIFIMN